MQKEAVFERVFEIFHGVDLIVHAGDITQKKVLDELGSIAPVVAVLGNNDKLDLKMTEIIEAGNFQIAVNHATSYSADFEKLHKFACKMDADVLITGHIHRPHCKIVDGVLLVNPGSSNRPIESDASVALMEICDGQETVDEIEVIFLGL
ncbi:MAG: YfcE family phosphodiesterase [Methanobrevibacter millerae]|uniref:Phosphoesterase n=1 Tax=Methanobrevibacter millerae TaxID=230361 RepID=A0A8T3VSA7_9EURY|nr:YfcE family phosphodiesterase [Methanobrevibacter millerae]